MYGSYSGNFIHIDWLARYRYFGILCRGSGEMYFKFNQDTVFISERIILLIGLLVS